MRLPSAIRAPLMLFLLILPAFGHCAAESRSGQRGAKGLRRDLAEWRFATRDGSERAGTDFDYSGWETAELPPNLPIASSGGWVWLRLSFETDSPDLSFILGKLDAAGSARTWSRLPPAPRPPPPSAPKPFGRPPTGTAWVNWC